MTNVQLGLVVSFIFIAKGMNDRQLSLAMGTIILGVTIAVGLSNVL
jgi:hypothetical protein